MKMTPCTSSQIKAHGHDPETDTLEIHYNSGGIYHYHGVSAEKYADLAKAESVGRHIHANIKGQHKFTHINKKEGS